jgi:hypothetical protein
MVGMYAKTAENATAVALKAGINSMRDENVPLQFYPQKAR